MLGQELIPLSNIGFNSLLLGQDLHVIPETYHCLWTQPVSPPSFSWRRPA